MTDLALPPPIGTVIGDVVGGKFYGRVLPAKPDGTLIDPATSDAQAQILTAVQAVTAALGAALTIALPTGAATDAGLAAIHAQLAAALTVNLPAGAATSAKQDAALAANAPFGGRVAMTVGTAVTAGRGIEIVATAAGNVSLTLADASIAIVPVAVGLTVLDYAVTTVNATGTTATAIYGKLI